jgi:hypothetical protein
MNPEEVFGWWGSTPEVQSSKTRAWWPLCSLPTRMSEVLLVTGQAAQQQFGGSEFLTSAPGSQVNLLHAVSWSWG